MARERYRKQLDTVGQGLRGWSPPGASTAAGQHSIRINQQWRLCFVWRDGDAYDVEIVDYH
ncbi:MAG: type II toxin-antitoxin system RelE/ParE family toxin [Thermoanaerobaculia bacterium]